MSIDPSPEVQKGAENWNDYARERIAAGLVDVESGRTIDGDQFLAWLRTQRLKDPI